MDNRKSLILQTIFSLYPDASCELKYQTPIELAIAVILSAQATDQMVNQVTPGFFERFKTLESLANASLQEIETAIQRIGLYRSKASHLKVFAQELLSKHNGVLPSNFNDLVSLAGIGRKTANVIQAVAFHQPALAVDTHVYRVAHRLGLVTSNADVYKTELQLKRLIPREQWIQAHHSILFFGRYHCKARQPNCQECPLFEQCRFKEKVKCKKKAQD